MKIMQSMCALAVCGVLVAPVAAQPVNDNCANATSVTVVSGTGSTAVDTNSATEDGARASCGWTSGSTLLATRDVWYSYSPTTSGQTSVAASDCSAGIFQGLSATLFAECPPGGTELSGACARDLCYEGPLLFNRVAGTTYLIRIASYAFSSNGSPQQGTATLTITELAVPPNDNCASAQTINISNGTGSASVSTHGASEDGPRATCGRTYQSQLVGTRDVWYKYTPTLTSGLAEVTAQSCTDLSRGLSATVFASCPSGGTPSAIACARDICSEGPLEFFISPGELYYLRIASYASTAAGLAQQGTAIVTINEIPPAENDDCAAATAAVGLGEYAWDDRVASFDGPLPSCATGAGQEAQKDVWFDYTATNTGVTAIDCNGARVVLSVYAGSCGGSLVACEGFSGVPNQNWLSFRSVENAHYIIRVAREIGQSDGPGSLRIREYDTPVGDSCSSPATLSVGTNSVNNIGVCDDEPNDAVLSCSRYSFATRWFRYTPTASGIVIFDVPNVSNQTNGMVIFLYDACGGELVDCSSDKGHVVAAAQNGVPILLRASAPAPLTQSSIFEYYRSFDLTVTQQAALAGDTCGTAVGITPGTTDFTNHNASQPLSSPAYGCSSPNLGSARHDLWFKWTAPSNGDVSVSTCFPNAPLISANETLLTVHSGSCAGPEIRCNDNHEDAPNDPPFYAQECLTDQSGTYFTAAAGTTYYFRVGTFRESIGPGKINLTFAATACAADFNGVNGVTVQDIFDFLTAWLGGNASADFNGVNGVTVQDIFDFLTAWLAGC